ncbi:MAG: GmrSD restriction endonuclease domain-containing protein [Phocaeicola sp.]
MLKIGYLTSFSDFITKYSVEIPRIQRDYTYGAKTEKTEKVLHKLLHDIHSSLHSGEGLILDFVYGCEDEAFQPLDGQQRLTTLYLIYLFAACKADVSLDKSFKYATRDDSTIFCSELLRFSYVEQSGSLVEQIKDSAFYRPSFNDDPSIRSILVVLDRIEAVFADMVSEENPSFLWEKLNEDCPVKFYCLDFGVFTLSDDLYIKMNSRGKQLTEYEIFKSQFEKYIEVSLKDKDLKYTTARLFDNDYIDLVWAKQGRDKSKIDNAFVYLFKNLFILLNHKFRSGSVQFDWNKSLYHNMSLLELNKEDIAFLMDFLDSFRYIQLKASSFLDDNFYKNDTLILEDSNHEGKIRLFKSNVDVFADACSSILKNPQLVTLYAIYKAIHAEKKAVDNQKNIDGWQSNFRHIRNLIEFSDDEIGHADRLHDMFSEIDQIIDGGITSIAAKDSKFNTIQFEEELEKARNKNAWKSFWRYENHDILRGSLSQFAHPNSFTLSDDEQMSVLSERLRKFTFIFDNNAKENDKKIRAYLLSIGDISQQHNMQVQNRMVGRQYGSWRLMFTKNNFYKSEGIRIINILDKVDTNSHLKMRTLSKDNWRYYVSSEKYYDSTYVSYGEAKYGYYYFMDESKPLEMWLLQSTSCNTDNVMWKLLNKLLFQNLPDGLHIDFNKYQEGHTIKLNKEISIDALQEGWFLEDLTEDKHIMDWLLKKTTINNNLLSYTPGEDHIEEMIGVINELIKEKILLVTE